MSGGNNGNGGDIFAWAGPRWYTIPSGRCFLDDLAQGLCQSLGHDLPSATILTPTRRGARLMAQAFSQQARGKALLLPQVRAIGDLDEGEPPFDLDALGLDLPPALSPLRRRFELARLIAEHYDGLGGGAPSGKLALELADSLAGFFDSLALEEVDASDKLDSLVRGEGADEYTLAAWAEHWQVSARFLAIAVRRWPQRLLELERMDPSQRQVVLIRRLAEQWRDRPPATPLILAGTTGSAPSTADLSNIVARAPMGAVVLPGLDLSLAEDAWRQIEDSHPQATMKRLLDRHRVRRDDVREWPASLDADRKARARRRLINEALRPAAATADWRDQIAALRQENDRAVEEGLDGLYEIHSARDEEAASAIALLMRETLETPQKVVALITPDLTLARRVAARLTRWGLTADISAGEPLSASLTGRFLLDLLALMDDPADPVRLLDLFHNPLCRFAGKSAIDTIDLRALRGATPSDAAMIATLLQGHEEALALWGDFTAHLAPVLTGFGDAPADLGATLTRFVQVAESLARDKGQVLWAGAPGAEASSLFSELIREGQGFAVRHAREFGDIVGALIRKAKVRTGGNFHPRLLILGAIESRLVKADRMILAGLEEGVWPQAPDNDPFLSRPMRARLGLPSPERRTGLSAHDFVQGATAPEVYLVTRHRREGEPQVQSRWLWRLQTLAKGAGAEIQTHPDIIDWARALDCGLPVKPAELKPAHQPAPAPPLAARPTRMSVTEVETFVRDPYAVYARRVLTLKPVDRPNEPVEARQRGTAIHRSLERFVAENAPLGEEGVRQLTGLLAQELAATHLSPAQMALQRPLLPGMAAAFVDFEAGRRASRPRLRIEQDGQLTFATGRGDFTLTARADRLEVREDGPQPGGADIIDFKTGGHASVKQVLAGFYPQLTLTAAILKRGGFAGIAAGTSVGDMIYVRLSPDKTSVRPVRDKAMSNDDLAEVALARLKARLAAYDDPKKGYKSWTAPQFLKGRGGDYDQLARLYEWYVLGDDEASDVEESEA
jgi:ATP-dependent helicase/nuclease subunit B